MTTKIYTTGYGRTQPEQLINLVHELGAILVDIRFSPWGRPGFKGFELMRALGPRYLHVKSLGNALYKEGGMRIADYDAGRAALAKLDSPALLLCACESPEHCHRTVVANLLRQDGFTVVEVSTTQPVKPPPQLGLWSEA
jgi:uncharacterized protein (DUF488 family)